jgi:hypothetical protein
VDDGNAAGIDTAAQGIRMAEWPETTRQAPAKEEVVRRSRRTRVRRIGTRDKTRRERTRTALKTQGPGRSRRRAGGARLVWRARRGKTDETRPEKVKRLVVAAIYHYFDWGAPPTDPQQTDEFLSRSIRDLLGGDADPAAMIAVARGVVTYTDRYIRREFTPPDSVRLPDAEWLMGKASEMRLAYAQEIDRRLPSA